MTQREEDICLLLRHGQRRYGAELIALLRQASPQTYGALPDSALYTALRRMEAPPKRLLRSSQGAEYPQDGPHAHRRRYYMLTAHGEEAVQALQQRRADVAREGKKGGVPEQVAVQLKGIL